MKTDLVVTGYIFNSKNNKLLLIHHGKLNLWLPVGGHMEQNEVPDDALIREIREETSLEINILSIDPIKKEGSTKRILSKPFHVNVHSVGDHDHCSFFYICRALNPEDLKINNELKSYKWVTESELSLPDIKADVRNIGLEAFRQFRELSQNSP